MTEMSKDDIETLSANAVENSCAKTQYLTASLRKRDKEPSWDGEIYIYNDKRKKKEDIESNDFIEDMAREKLDMYLPNEKVYMDTGY